MRLEYQDIGKPKMKPSKNKNWQTYHTQRRDQSEPKASYRQVRESSAFLNRGERHRVWRPCPSTTARPSKGQVSKLLTQKSQSQLLADRKKLLDTRLLATREALKLKNLEEVQGTDITKSPSSDMPQGTKTSNATRRKSLEHFHTIVDKYAAMIESPDIMAASSPVSPSAIHGGAAFDSAKFTYGMPPSAGSFHPLQFTKTFSPPSTPAHPTFSSPINWSRQNITKQAALLSFSTQRKESPLNDPLEKKFTGTQGSDMPSRYAPKRVLSKSDSPVLRVQSAGAILVPEEKQTSTFAGASLPI